MSDEKSAVDQQEVIGAVTEAPKTADEKDQDKALKEFGAAVENGKPVMKVKVHSPFNDYFDGQAYSVTAENRTGVFDILPQHHNFISLLSPCELVVRSVSESDKKIKISGGIMHVKSNEIIVFLDV